MSLTPSLAPGSIPWLLAHELRLAFRARSKKQGRTLLVIGIVLAVLMLVAGVPLGLFLRYVPIGETPGVLMTLDLILAAVFTLILSQTLASAVTGFYERGDLDLMLSSPLPPRRVLTVRALGIAVAPLLWFASLLSILVIPAAVLGQPRWLTAYPVLLALAMLASAAGMSLAMGLIRLIGARRTRTVGQLLAALIGAGFFLFGQLRNMLPDHGQQFFAGVMRWADSGVLAPAAPLAWPPSSAARRWCSRGWSGASAGGSPPTPAGRQASAPVPPDPRPSAGRARAGSRAARARP